MLQIWFFKCYSWETFKTIFEILSALGACLVTINGGIVYKKSMICEVFREYLCEFSSLLREMFFVSKILSSCYDKQPNFECRCSSYPGTRLKVPILAVFWRFWAFLELPVLAQAFSLGHWFFYEKLVQCIYFHVW